MKKEKKLVTVLVSVLLAAALGLFGYWKYQDQFVRIGDVRYEKNAQEITLSAQLPEDLQTLRAFTALEKIDLRGSGISVQEYEQVKQLLPQTEILWDIPFQGAVYPMETSGLTLEHLTLEDLETLQYFTELKTVSAENCPDYQVLHELRSRYPELQVTYSVPVAGENYSHDMAALKVPGEDIAGLMEILPYFTSLETVELVPPLAPVEEILTLREAFPDVYFSWQLEIAGIAVNESTETLDLSGLPVTVEQMDAVLPYLLNLTFVDMTDCGISNEEMDALNRRYENVKIVWTVLLGSWYTIRTDATTFMPAKDNYYPKNDELYNLRYCTDMIAIDVGHRRITDIEFAAYMPHLQYLLMCETFVRDITPLTGLKELKFLELFLNSIYDLSPLVTLTGLEDLNLHFVEGDPEIVAQMTWLNTLWWGNVEERALSLSQQKMLREAIPDCKFNFGATSSTGHGWRDLPNYFAQRDLFGLHYMKG